MKKEICKNCTHYAAYYQQRSDSYSRLNHGFCSKHERGQGQYGVCEVFKSNELKENRRQKRMLDSLESALTSINEIAQIIREKESGGNEE